MCASPLPYPGEARLSFHYPWYQKPAVRSVNDNANAHLGRGWGGGMHFCISLFPSLYPSPSCSCRQQHWLPFTFLKMETAISFSFSSSVTAPATPLTSMGQRAQSGPGTLLSPCCCSLGCSWLHSPQSVQLTPAQHLAHHVHQVSFQRVRFLQSGLKFLYCKNNSGNKFGVRVNP